MHDYQLCSLMSFLSRLLNALDAMNMYAWLRAAVTTCNLSSTTGTASMTKLGNHTMASTLAQYEQLQSVQTSLLQ